MYRTLGPATIVMLWASAAAGQGPPQIPVRTGSDNVARPVVGSVDVRIRVLNQLDSEGRLVHGHHGVDSAGRIDHSVLAVARQSEDCGPA